jgi:DnaK suppressor protein
MADYTLLLRDSRERTARAVFELTGVIKEIIDSSTLANLDDEHDPEGATVAFERAQVAVLLERAHHQLREVDEALGRIRLGTYGHCEVCGSAIPAERLEAKPATRVCVACAAE